MAEAVHHNRTTLPPPLAMLPAPECIIKFLQTKCHIAHNGYRHQPYFILPARKREEEEQQAEEEEDEE